LFGLLGGEYFLDNIQVLRSMGCRWSIISVFLDDIVAARNLFEKNLEDENVLFIEPPEGSDDAESLVLMSLAAHHIISNPTFSYGQPFWENRMPRSWLLNLGAKAFQKHVKCSQVNG